jgi:acetoin utilization deacetylase AcuC-like enzyme
MFGILVPDMHIFTHPVCLKHTPPPDPDFAPKRLNVVIEALRAKRFADLEWREAPALAPEKLALAHTPEYVADVMRPIALGEKRFFTSDTVAVSGTAEAALHAAGAVWAATADVMAGKIDKAFCIVGPSGHHAEADTAGGFCFFNNIALAAIAAQKNMGARRVAVVDFDAHHGNGTQSFFWNFEDRLFISLHEETKLSGFAHETGAWDNVVNIPLMKRSDGKVMRQAFAEKAAPKIEAFKPDILFISAGFDMHKDDPLSSLHLETKDYEWLGINLRELADALCNGRLVAVLEGGYNLGVLGDCVAAFVAGIMGLENGKR